MDLCETRNTLINEWGDAKTLYAQLVASVVAQIGVMVKEDFDHLLKTVGIAADPAESKRKDFELHIQTHTCSKAVCWMPSLGLFGPTGPLLEITVADNRNVALA